MHFKEMWDVNYIGGGGMGVVKISKHETRFIIHPKWQTALQCHWWYVGGNTQSSFAITDKWKIVLILKLFCLCAFRDIRFYQI